MAEKVNDVEIADEGGKSKKMIIIIAVVVLALIGGGAFFFLSGGDETTAETEDATKPVKQTPIYATVEKPLIVNFAKQSNNAVRYLQIKLKVMARDQAVIDAFELHTPAIQHQLLLLFFDQTYDSLITPEGKKALKEQTLNTINDILKQEQTEGELEAVYFTSLIMQ